MPEGDTLFRIREALGPVLEGKAVSLRLPQRGSESLRLTVTRVHVHGKNLLILFSDDRALYTHLKMQGVWHVYRQNQAWARSKARATATLETATHTAVCFDAPSVVLLSVLKTRRFLASLNAKADVLSENFDCDAAALRLISADVPIAVALLDQSLLAGIGNVYKSEALFAARIHPEQPANALGLARAKVLVVTAQAMMRANVASIKSGSPGAHYRYVRTTRSGCEVGKGAIAVYGRQGRACYTCGEALSMIRQGPLQRSTYFCSTCQT
jgi:endonuclease VIII